MTRNKLFSTQQFGFIKGHSNVLQLLNIMESWTKDLDRGESIDVVYPDFMKAFDTVPHKRLIGKLKSYGIEYYTPRWIQASLSDRVQQVSVNGINSEQACYQMQMHLNPHLNVEHLNAHLNVEHLNFFMHFHLNAIHKHLIYQMHNQMRIKCIRNSLNTNYYC